MNLASDDKIYSTTISIEHLDLLAKDKSQLDNLDLWATAKENGVVTESYVIDIFDKIAGKKELAKKEEKKENSGAQPQPRMPAGPPGYQPHARPTYNPFGNEQPRIIGDPDPLRIGGPRGGLQGNLVGPNSSLF